MSRATCTLQLKKIKMKKYLSQFVVGPLHTVHCVHDHKKNFKRISWILMSAPFVSINTSKFSKDFVRFWCQPIDFLVSSYFWIPKTLNASWNFAVIRNVVQLTRKAPLQNVERYQKHTQIWLSKTLQIFLEKQWAANDCFPMIKNVSGTCCEWNFRFYGTNLKKLYIIILYKICQLLLVQLFPKSSRYLKLSQKNTEISKSQLW